MRYNVRMILGKDNIEKIGFAYCKNKVEICR